MKNRLSNLLFSTAMIFVGIQFLRSGYSDHFGFPILPSTAVLMIVFGLLMMAMEVHTKRGDHAKDKMMVCTKCKEKYKAKHVSILICPKCNGKLKPDKEENEH